MTIASVSPPAAPAAGSAAPTPSGQADPAAAALFGLLVGQSLESAQARAQAQGSDVAPAAPGPLAPAALTTPVPTSSESIDGTTAGEETPPEAAGVPVCATTSDPALRVRRRSPAPARRLVPTRGAVSYTHLTLPTNSRV